MSLLRYSKINIKCNSKSYVPSYCTVDENIIAIAILEKIPFLKGNKNYFTF